MSDNTAVCITHFIDGARPCMVRDKHFAACSDDDCFGCVPRAAAKGYVCAGCQRRIERAEDEWSQFQAAFAGEVRALHPETGGATSKPGSRLPMSPLQLAFDELERLVRAMNVYTPEGAKTALQFARTIERAARNFPRKEAQTRLTTNRCPECARRTLVYQPAEHLGGEATVVCLNTECGHVMDHSAFERIALIEAQCCRRCRDVEGCTNPGCTCHRFAPVPEWQRTSKGDFEPFNPDRADHAALKGTT